MPNNKILLLLSSIVMGPSVFGSTAGNKYVAQPKEQISFSMGRRAFERGSCPEAISYIQGFLGRKELLHSTKDIAESYKMLAICLVQEGDIKAATKEIESLLFLDPTAQMDPFSTPPAVMELFRKVAEEIRQKTIELGQITEITRENMILHNGPKKEISMLAAMTAFVPLGYPQYVQDRRYMAISLAATEITLLGLNLVGYWWKRNLVLPNNPAAVASSEEVNRYGVAQTLQFVAIGGFFAVYIYGVVDAFLAGDYSSLGGN